MFGLFVGVPDTLKACTADVACGACLRKDRKDGKIKMAASSPGRRVPSQHSKDALCADKEDSSTVKEEKQGMLSYGSEELSEVQCRLETKELWDKFHELGTEMIITKTGR